jgi:hypothetical protein
MQTLKFFIFNFLFLLLANTANSQSKFDEKIIDTTCSFVEKNVLFVLSNLASKTNNFNDRYTIEVLREVHSESMAEIKTKLQRISSDLRMKSNSGFIELGLNSAFEDFKYGLCQKYQRKEANVNSLAKESYFLCRKSISEGYEQRPMPCF